MVENMVFTFQTKKMSLKERRSLYLEMAERCFNNIEINKHKGLIHQENINLNKEYFKEVGMFIDDEWTTTTMNFNMTDPNKAHFVMVGFLLLYAQTF